MALHHLPLQFPLISLPYPHLNKLNKLTPIPLPLTTSKPRILAIRATSTENEDKPTNPDNITDIGSEIKKAMEEREEILREKEIGFFEGVAEEVKEIEWPVFGKVVGTTGVVLSVIFGSSVVLLTLNALLAEFSDRVFAGRGVQDFFG